MTRYEDDLLVAAVGGNEAAFHADRIVVLEAGRVAQAGTTPSCSRYQSRPSI